VAQPTRILFVCLGNIVRSPLAENLFRHLAEQAGVGNKYEVDSAGTAAYHVGNAPDPRMRRVAAERGLEYSGRGRQIRQEDFEDFDLLISMDTSNYADLMNLASNPGHTAKVRLMRDFDAQADGQRSVPDPYYGGLEGFEHVYDVIERSAGELLRRLEAGEVELA
jgi:protein-tyrosine phosphatase